MKLKDHKAKPPVFKAISPVDNSEIEDLTITFKFYDSPDFLKLGLALQSVSSEIENNVTAFLDVVYEHVGGLIRSIQYEGNEVLFDDFKADVLEQEDFFFVKKQLVDFVSELTTQAFGDDKSYFFHPVKKKKA